MFKQRCKQLVAALPLLAVALYDLVSLISWIRYLQVDPNWSAVGAGLWNLFWILVALICSLDHACLWLKSPRFDAYFFLRLVLAVLGIRALVIFFLDSLVSGASFDRLHGSLPVFGFLGLSLVIFILALVRKPDTPQNVSAQS